MDASTNVGRPQLAQWGNEASAGLSAPATQGTKRRKLYH
jgi:hypothetical protein